MLTIKKNYSYIWVLVCEFIFMTHINWDYDIFRKNKKISNSCILQVDQVHQWMYIFYLKKIRILFYEIHWTHTWKVYCNTVLII